MELNQGFNEPLEAEVVLTSASSSLAARRPGGVNFICITAIVLGAMGLLAALLGMFNSLAGAQIQRAFSMPTQPGAPAEFAKLQEEYQANIAGVMERYAVVNFAIALFHLAIAAGLIWGGIRCLRLTWGGRGLLMYACLGAVGFEIIRTFPTVLMQLEMSGIIEQFVQGIVETMPANGPPGLARYITMVVKGSFFVGLLFTFAWLLIKIVFYTLSVRYLSLPRIAGLFGEGEGASNSNAPPRAD